MDTQSITQLHIKSFLLSNQKKFSNQSAHSVGFETAMDRGSRQADRRGFTECWGDQRLVLSYMGQRLGSMVVIVLMSRRPNCYQASFCLVRRKHVQSRFVDRSIRSGGHRSEILFAVRSRIRKLWVWWSSVRSSTEKDLHIRSDGSSSFSIRIRQLRSKNQSHRRRSVVWLFVNTRILDCESLSPVT